MAATKKPVKARASGGLKKPRSSPNTMDGKTRNALAKMSAEGRFLGGQLGGYRSGKEYKRAANIGQDAPKKPTRKGVGGKTML